MIRYHIRRGEKRTTISLDNILSNLLAIKLKTVPESKEAHIVVRKWLQKITDEENDLGRLSFSQWLNQQAILEISDKILSEKYYDWLCEEY